jgi:hypothetical protein
MMARAPNALVANPMAPSSTNALSVAATTLSAFPAGAVRCLGTDQVGRATTPDRTSGGPRRVAGWSGAG